MQFASPFANCIECLEIFFDYAFNSPLAWRVQTSKHAGLDCHIFDHRADCRNFGFYRDCRRGGGHRKNPFRHFSSFVFSVIDWRKNALTMMLKIFNFYARAVQSIAPAKAMHCDFHRNDFAGGVV